MLHIHRPHASPFHFSGENCASELSEAHKCSIARNVYNFFDVCVRNIGRNVFFSFIFFASLRLSTAAVAVGGGGAIQRQIKIHVSDQHNQIMPTSLLPHCEHTLTGAGRHWLREWVQRTDHAGSLSHTFDSIEFMRVLWQLPLSAYQWIRITRITISSFSFAAVLCSALDCHNWI